MTPHYSLCNQTVSSSTNKGFFFIALFHFQDFIDA